MVDNVCLPVYPRGSLREYNVLEGFLLIRRLVFTAVELMRISDPCHKMISVIRFDPPPKKEILILYSSYPEYLPDLTQRHNETKSLKIRCTDNSGPVIANT